jgi:ferredoxin
MQGGSAETRTLTFYHPELKEPQMAQVREFYVEPDLCTECGDCMKAVPQAFRKVEDEEVAEVYNTTLDESFLPKLEKIMTECPGHAILWRK